jgi:hypothetical protein
VTEVERELERLRDLARLEGFVRLEDLEALLTIARFAPEATQRELLEVARAIFEGKPHRLASDFSSTSVRGNLEAMVGVIAHPGLNAADFVTLELGMNGVLVALEDLHRSRLDDPLEAAGFATLEAVKAALFGRGLNVAERARLRGIYERTKLLRSW